MEKILENKKLLLILGAIILVVLIVFIATSKSRQAARVDTTDEYTTDSSEADKALAEEMELLKNYPIANLLPFENSDPYYYVSYNLNNESENSFSIEIFYKEGVGLTAAKARLDSSEFSEYSPSQYQIKTTLLSD